MCVGGEGGGELGGKDRETNGSREEHGCKEGRTAIRRDVDLKRNEFIIKNGVDLERSEMTIVRDMDAERGELTIIGRETDVERDVQSKSASSLISISQVLSFHLL